MRKSITLSLLIHEANCGWLKKKRRLAHNPLQFNWYEFNQPQQKRNEFAEWVEQRVSFCRQLNQNQRFCMPLELVMVDLPGSPLFALPHSSLSLSLFLFILFFSLCWLINWRAAVRERVKEVKGVVFGLASLGRKSITVYSVIKNLWFLWRRQWSCATKHTTSLPFQRKIKVFFFFSIQWSEMFVLLRWVGNKKIL